jgi:outer membrane protein insertion porin family
MILKSFHTFKTITIPVFLLCLLSACNTTKYLQKEQSLVKKNSIIFKSNSAKSQKDNLETELLTFIQQKPNTKFLMFVPREFLYFSKFKSQGQEPVIYNDSISKKTAKNMENYLKFKKGYYNALVDYFTDEKSELKSWTKTAGTDLWEEKTTEVTYVVSLGDRYKIRELKYECEDQNLLALVKNIQKDGNLKSGDYINFDAFELEKHRIANELQNLGYQGFSSSQIEIYGDSNQVNKYIDVFMKLRSPEADNKYTKFTIGSVNIYTDYVKDFSGVALKRENFQNVNYYRQSTKNLVSPKIINKMMFLRPDSLLRKDDRTKTFRKLSNLSTYRFVTINSSKDPLRDSVLNFDIILSPHLNRWIIDGELGLYLSTLSGNYLWGAKTTASLQNRNAFGGSELYSIRAEIGSEFGRSESSVFVPRTSNVSIQNSLNLPSFKDYLGLGQLFSSTKVIKSKFYKNFTDEASTNIELGYSKLNIFNLYSVGSFNARYGYDYISTRGNRYAYRPLGFNLDIYNLNNSIDNPLINNPLVQLSFKDNLGTGFLLRDFSFVLNKPKDSHGKTLTLFNNLEFSGVEVELANRLFNTISGSGDVWKIHSPRDLSFAKYIRNEFDGRIRKDYSKTSSIAGRLNLGVILPFGVDRVSPFIKQFSAGGPNSMRGWRLKELGPGGYRDPATLITEIPSVFVYQGDFKLEMNAEYRFKIIYIFEGGLFLDAGNVWTLRADPDRPDANISSKFVNQIAISGGYGLRFNFDYFIVRFDFGYKLRSPYQDPLSNKYWYSLREITGQGIGNVQVAVNYPF